MTDKETTVCLSVSGVARFPHEFHWRYIDERSILRAHAGRVIGSILEACNDIFCAVRLRLINALRAASQRPAHRTPNRTTACAGLPY
jgi:hypothetical protein